jgi:hypothetical protein
MIDPKILLVLALAAGLVMGVKTAGTAIKTAAQKTAHVAVRVFKHPVHSVKNGAIHKAPSEQ